MKTFFRVFAITAAVLATVITIKTTAEYILSRYKKTYINV